MTVLAPFAIHRAHSVAEAAGLIDELGEEAVYYAGGTELLLLMKLGFARYEHLVDVKPIAELSALHVRDGWLVIGGTVTHRDVERSALVRGGWPDLVEMERRVANVRVRGTGSLGGNLAFADPHSDPATFLLAAGARVVVGRGNGQRAIDVADLIQGPYETALEPSEVLLAIEIPPLPAGTAMAHLRFAFHERPAATVSAWTQVEGDGILDARAAVGSVGDRPVIVPGVAKSLAGLDAGRLDRRVLAGLGEAGADAAEPVSDNNGSADYKHALVATLIGRALTEAAGRALARSAA